MPLKRKSHSNNGNRKKSCGGAGGDPSLTPCIASIYKSKDFLSNFGNAFQSGCSYDTECRIYNEPFLCCEVPNFVEPDDFLQLLKAELSNVDYMEKNNDLFRFSQTNDLKFVSTPAISLLKDFMESEVSHWLTVITGYSFAANVDITSSRYEHTDVLLCHDDELEGRKIAYILYLVSPWEEKDGGSLDLFNINEDKQPAEVVRSIYPAWNNFVFFEVTPKSFHQVAEILTEDKLRLSINGWFHAPTEPRAPLSHDVRMPLEPAVDGEMDLLAKWINPLYLKIETQLQIRQKFEEDSETQLNNFLNEQLYVQLCQDLKELAHHWVITGPPTRRRYEKASSDVLSVVAKELIQLLSSMPFFIFLSSVTGLKLHPLAAVDSESDDECAEPRPHEEEPASAACGRCYVELRRWKWRSYSLLKDNNEARQGFSLDAYLFFNCAGWKYDYGGFISYVADGEADELLSIMPSENALALVYREEETNSFVKYVNKNIEAMNSAGEFHSLYATYVE